MITAQQAKEKWLRNLQAATPSITDGVNAVTVAPGQKAAQAKQLWLSQLQANADKWAKNVGAVTLGEWQTAMTTYGIPRIAQGAIAKQAKVEEFMTKFLPHVAQGAAAVNALPKGGLENGIARATAMIRHNATFKR